MLTRNTRSVIRDVLLIDGMFGYLFEIGNELISFALLYNQLRVAYTCLVEEMDTGSIQGVALDLAKNITLILIVKLMIAKKTQLGIELLQMQNVPEMPNLNDFDKLKSELSTFWINSGLHKGDELLAENFIKYLKQNGKQNELLTLVKLGADKNDCLISIPTAVLYQKAEDSTVKCRKDSLQWLSSRAIAKSNISAKEATQEAQDLVSAAQTFPGLENKPEQRRRRFTPMGIM